VLITRFFRNGNSIAIRVPAELAFPETDNEVEIERIGDELRIRPVRRPPTGTVEQFAGSDADADSKADGC
jgi:antitoxin VapB